tara:strand:+ start:237 stop:1172 length:936 start_codon:yes stop_codon:yes gene_type:complete
MQVDWEQLRQYTERRKQKRQADFDADFWESKIRNMVSNTGTFSVKDKTISIPQDNVSTPADMWNQYLRATESRGLKPDYRQFVDQYNNLNKIKTTKLLNTLGNAQASGMSTKDIRKAVKKDPELQALVKEAMNLLPNDQKAELGQYIAPGRKGFLEDPMGNLGTLGAGAAGYFAATKGGPAIASAWQNLRGADTIKSFDDLKGKAIPDNMKSKLRSVPASKKQYGKYKGKKSFADWKKSTTPKNWSKTTYDKAIDKFGVKDFKKVGLVNPKSSVAKTLLKGSGKLLKGILGPKVQLGLGAMAAFEALKNRE